MSGNERRQSELWIRTIERAGNVLLFVVVLSFFEPLHWISLAFTWEGNHIVKERPVASEARPEHSKRGVFVDLHIGRSNNPIFPEYVIQAWDVIITPEEIHEFVDVARERHEEIDLPRFYVRLFIGPDVPMNMVRSVQMELRKAGVYKVMYMTWVE